MKPFWRQISRFFGQNASNGRFVGAFVFGSVAVGVVGSAIFELVIEWGGRSFQTLWLTVALPLVIIVLVGFVFASFANRRRSATTPDQDDEEVPPYPVLILFVSPGENKSHTPAIDYHAQSGKLRDCYLIYTNEESRENAEEVQAQFADSVPRFDPRRLDDATSVRAAFEFVRATIDHAGIDGTTTDEILVDITGGTKMMTAGAVLACADRRVAIQYIDLTDSVGNRAKNRPKIRRVLLSNEIGERDAPEAG